VALRDHPLQSSSCSSGLLYKVSLPRAYELPLSYPNDTRGFDARRYNRRRLYVPHQGECRMSSRVLSSVALAAAAAVMFSTVAVSTASAEEGKVKCEGVNSCKGHSACKSANNACKGQNSCKGKGWTEMTQAQCDAAKAKAKAGG
jgi:hypothetical protein